MRSDNLTKVFMKKKIKKRYLIFESNTNNDTNERPSYLNSNNVTSNSNDNIEFRVCIKYKILSHIDRERLLVQTLPLSKIPFNTKKS